MAEKSFGVKEVNLIGASGTPSIISPNNLNLNAVNVAISTNVSIGGTLTVSGSLSIGGTITYEDVTNIDSVGIVTARNGLNVSGGNVTIAKDIDVDGHTNLDNVSVAGVTTISNDLYIKSSLPKIYLTDTNHDSDWYISNSDGTIIFYDQTTTNTRFEINPGGSSDLPRPFIRTPFNTDSVFRGHTILGGHAASPNHTLTVAGISTFNGNINVNADLDVDGHTNLDNVNVAGVSTFAGDVIINSGSELLVNTTTSFESATGFGNLVVGAGSGSEGIIIYSGNGVGYEGVLGFADGTSGAAAWGAGIRFRHDINRFRFQIGGSERLALDSSGNLNVTGVCTATSFVGDGSSLTGIAVTEAPVVDYTVTANGSSAYRFHGGGVDETADDPDLYLIRGQKYRFNNTTGSSHPFAIREASGGSAYSNGVTGSQNGIQFFTVPYDAPAKIFYQCTSHSGMVGNIYIRGANGQNDNVGVTTFSGDITIPDSIIHSGNANTKIRFPAANQISFETSGNQRMIIGTGGAISIEDTIQHLGDTNTKIRFPENDQISFETAGSERLRILSSGELRIISSGNNNDPAHLRLHCFDASISANDAIGQIRFAGRDSGGTAVSRTGALIQATAAATWDTGQTTGYSATNLDFFTQNNSGTDTVAAGARLRIGATGISTFSAGNVNGISFPLTVKNDNNDADYDMGTGIKLHGGSSTEYYKWSAIVARGDNNGQGGYSNTQALAFYTYHGGLNSSGGTEKMRLTSGGNLGIGTVSALTDLHIHSGTPRITMSDSGTGAHHRINADSSVGNFNFDIDYNSVTSTPAFIVNIKGDEKLRITSTGIINAPTQAGFYARMQNNKDNVMGGGASYYTVVFDTDSGSICYDQHNTYSTSTGLYTVPTGGDGHYMVSTAVCLSTDAYGRAGEAWFLVGSNRYFFDRRYFTNTSGTITGYYGTCNIKLTAGQTVGVQAFVSGGSTDVDVLGASSANHVTWFTGRKIP